MIKAVEVPDEFEEKPRILALMCENDAVPALELAAQHRLRLNPYVRVVPVRCRPVSTTGSCMSAARIPG